MADTAPRPLIGLLAGVAAGVVAAAAMAAFQAQTSKRDDADGDDEPASQTANYVTGAVMGGIYGVLTEYRPEASAGFGGAYGVVTAALLDDGTAPALDPGPEADSTLYGVASHLLFGVVLEGVRWLIAGKR